MVKGQRYSGLRHTGREAEPVVLGRFVMALDVLVLAVDRYGLMQRGMKQLGVCMSI